MKNKRLMTIKYTNDVDAERLKTCLDMCCISFVAFREYEFVGGGALWRFYIDRGRLSWNDVMREINRVHAVKFDFVGGHYIENKTLYSVCN